MDTDSKRFRIKVQNASVNDRRQMIRERLNEMITVKYEASSEQHVTFLINKLMNLFQVEDLLDFMDEPEYLDAKIVQVTQFDDLYDANGHSDVLLHKDHEANISSNLQTESVNPNIDLNNYDWPALPAPPKKKHREKALSSYKEVGSIASTPANFTNGQIGDQSEFTECNYCGISIYDSVDDYDDFTISGTNQRKNATEVSAS